jgi:excisionase family DNA binding protein
MLTADVPGHPGAGARPAGRRLVSLQLGLELSDQQLAQLAEHVAGLLAERGLLAPPPDPDPWLDVDAAAAYLCCRRKRIYDLCSQRRVRFVKDGSRTLIRRSWLDAYLNSNEGSAPA